jgi:hypothetical protein
MSGKRLQRLIQRLAVIRVGASAITGYTKALAKGSLPSQWALTNLNSIRRCSSEVEAHPPPRRDHGGIVADFAAATATSVASALAMREKADRTSYRACAKNLISPILSS